MSAVQSMRAGIGIVVLASTLVVAVVAGAARGLETPEQTVGTSQLDQILLGRRTVTAAARTRLQKAGWPAGIPCLSVAWNCIRRT
jgi:hypothetical protein